MIETLPPPSVWHSFTPTMMLFAGVGAAIYWGKNGRKKLKVFVLSELLDSLKVPDDNVYRLVSEFILFIAFGVLIGVGVIGPTTIPQALTAGIAWTGMVSKRVE